MNIQSSPITHRQWRKVLKALAYSASSGFAGGFMIGLAGILQQKGSFDFHVLIALETGALVGGVVGALNSLAVTIEQLFTEDS